MLVREAFEDYLYAIRRLATPTQREYKSKLSYFVSWCEAQTPPPAIEEVKRPLLRRFFDHLAREHTNPRTGKPISTHTQHGYARTLKAFLTWCANEDDLEDLVSDAVPRKMEMPKVAEVIKEIFTKQQIASLLKAAEREYNEELQVRDRAIISVLQWTGIRGGELVGLTLDNCFFSPEDSYIKVFGKGQKWREVPLEASVQPLRRYINRFRRRNNEETRVFLNRYQKPLTVFGLDQTINRLGEWAGVEGAYPHRFRHTYAVCSLLRGLDIYRLRLRLGHSSVKVTEVYLKALEGILARRAEKLYV